MALDTYAGLSLLSVLFTGCFGMASSQGNVCVAYGNRTECSVKSTWAVNTPFLIVTHRISTTARPNFIISYSLDMPSGPPSSLCQYTVASSGCFSNNDESCVDCSDYISTNQSVVAIINITDVNLAKDQSRLVYSMPAEGIDSDIIQNFTILPCPQSFGYASATNTSIEPCGYDCTSQFDCIEGYVNNGSHSSTIYRCTAAAEWTPSSPPICVPKDTTTTETTVTTTTDSGKGTTTVTPSETDTTTTETAVNTTTGGVSKLDAQRKKLEIALSVIGGLSILADFDYKEMMPLAAALVCCMLAWGILIGVNAGVAEFAAFVSASVLGSFALLGMVVVIVLLILRLKGGRNTGIKGKKAADEDVSMNEQ